VQDARRCLRAALEAHELAEDVIDDSEIVLAELLGNAVRHAKSLPSNTVEVSWRVRSGGVDLQVTDGGSFRAVEPRPAEALAVAGRGLHIVAHLARAWGVVDLGGGRRTVWASLVVLSGNRLADVC
jgi:anti-sigma regulatory factor (Ser/Thr protein kinase)